MTVTRQALVDSVGRTRSAIAQSRECIVRTQQLIADLQHVVMQHGAAIGPAPCEASDEQLIRAIEGAQAQAQQREIEREMRFTSRRMGADRPS